MKAQNQSLADLPFTAILGVYGSYFGFILNVLCIIAQTFIAIAPIGDSPSAYNFFVNMLALPIIIVCYVGWKLVYKTKFVRASEADLLTGRREVDLAEMKRAELEERANWRWYQRFTFLWILLTLGCTT
jgi:yeast amino acid transporter